MRLLTLLAALTVSLSLIGCSSGPKKSKKVLPPSVAPSVTRVAQPLEKAEETVKKAKKTADSLSRDSKAPGDRQAADLVSDLSEAEKAISTARQELKKHEIEVKKQTDQLDKARQMALQHQEESQYWQEKHHKALEKLWFWRGLALTIAALIIAGTAGWIGWKVYGPKLPKFF